MNLLMLIGTFAVWGVIHSLLASLAVKDFFSRMFGEVFMRAYRLGYNIFSVLSLLPVFWLMWALPNQFVYSVPGPWKYLMLAGQGVAAFLLLYGVLQTDTLSFVGLRQLVERDSKPGRLVTGGLYRFVRHPLYSAGLLFLWLSAVMTVNQLIIYVCTTIYIFVGATFEERKLMREYGAVYAEYKAVTPMILPGWLFNRTRKSSRM